MTYSDATQYIHSLMRFGSRPGLERITLLLDKLGNPQENLKIIHVAGTNGKGSTCSFISSILKESGLKTGLYISPFVVRFNERIQINGKYIPDDDLASYTKQVKEIAETVFDEQNPITEFEFITALAFKYFKDMGCDAVVLEVGLGGRFDATNVITKPLVSCITQIDLDHTEILGDSLAKIAFEKCGIIKQGSKVVTTSDNKREALDVICDTAKNKGAQLKVADVKSANFVKTDISGTEFEYLGNVYKIKLLGRHQISNAVTAIETVKTAFSKISDSKIALGLENTVFPARCEVISGCTPVLLDGSHNPNGTSALDELLTDLGIFDATAIVGFMADKDVSAAIKIPSGHFSNMISVCVESNKRSMSAEALKDICLEFCENSVAANDYTSAINIAKSLNKPIVVFGSLYLAGDIRPIMQEHFSSKDY